MIVREFSGSLVFRTPNFHCWGPRFNPLLKTKIPQATQPKKKRVIVKTLSPDWEIQEKLLQWYMFLYVPQESPGGLLVSLDSRQGIWGVLSTRAVITLPRVNRSWLIFPASRALLPTAPERPMFSLPARSTLNFKNKNKSSVYGFGIQDFHSHIVHKDIK